MRVALGKIGCFDRNARGEETVRRRGGLDARRDAVVRGRGPNAKRRWRFEM